MRGNQILHRQPKMISRSIPACAGEPSAPVQWPPLPPVYPRVCGGTIEQRSREDCQGGLSPRVRGNPGNPGVPAVLAWSIPACAGEPPASRSRPSPPGVYPRVCGGTARPKTGLTTPTGLSPRVRGNPRPVPGRRAGPGSIPACAGEPSHPGRPAAPSRVYPRVCGGTLPQQPSRLKSGGLSPRVRGNLVPHIARAVKIGSIPACAGEPR